MQRKQAVLGILAVLLAARLLSGPFLQGFQRMETDFPNYYTAAKVTVQHMPLRQFYDWVWFQRQIHYAGVDPPYCICATASEADLVGIGSDAVGGQCFPTSEDEPATEIGSAGSVVAGLQFVEFQFSTGAVLHSDPVSLGCQFLLSSSPPGLPGWRAA